jgi:pimeloyl-ACP methyl ester carboxylesterase
VIAPTGVRIRTSRLTLAAYDWGGDGPPVLLAHPTGFHGRVWGPVATRLVAAGRRVWSFDFRGHGDSDAPSADDTDSYSWHGFADDLTAVANHLDLASHPDLVVCGHSKGGASALIAEAKRPGLFPRIWAYEPIVFSVDATRARQANVNRAGSAYKRRNEWPSIEAAYDNYASKPPMNAMTPESLRAYVEFGLRDRGDGTYELKCRPEVEARVYSMARENGAWELLPRVNALVCVACGEASTSVDPAHAARIVERLPRAVVDVLPGLGHFGPQQDPDACVDSLLRFTDTSRASA